MTWMNIVLILSKLKLDVASMKWCRVGIHAARYTSRHLVRPFEVRGSGRIVFGKTSKISLRACARDCSIRIWEYNIKKAIGDFRFGSCQSSVVSISRNGGHHCLSEKNREPSDRLVSFLCLFFKPNAGSTRTTPIWNLQSSGISFAGEVLYSSSGQLAYMFGRRGVYHGICFRTVEKAGASLRTLSKHAKVNFYKRRSASIAVCLASVLDCQVRLPRRGRTQVQRDEWNPYYIMSNRGSRKRSVIVFVSDSTFMNAHSNPRVHAGSADKLLVVLIRLLKSTTCHGVAFRRPSAIGVPSARRRVVRPEALGLSSDSPTVIPRRLPTSGLDWECGQVAGWFSIYPQTSSNEYGPRPWHEGLGND